MKFQAMVLCVVACLASVAFAQGPPSGESAKSPDATRFDGTWGVTLTCPDFKDAGVGAKGYALRFLMDVKDGVLNGQYGREGAPGWLKYEGRVQPDGTAEIQARGLTGDPNTAVDRVRQGTPYTYRMKAQFEGTRGRGTRLDLRPCEAVFVKQ